MVDVVALGDVLIDFICIDLNKTGYPILDSYPGGNTIHYLSAIANHGAKTAVLGKVGADIFGEKIMSTLNLAGIEVRGLVTSDNEFTTLKFMHLNERGDLKISFARKPGADSCIRFDELDFSLIDEAMVFSFGGLALTNGPIRSTTYQAVAYAKSKGKLISFNSSCEKTLWSSAEDAKKQVKWGLRQADIVKISDEEIRCFFSLDVESGVRYILEEYKVKLVVVACGVKEFYFCNCNGGGKIDGLSDVNPMVAAYAGDYMWGNIVWKLLQVNISPEALMADEIRDIISFACDSAETALIKCNSRKQD